MFIISFFFTLPLRYTHVPYTTKPYVHPAHPPNSGGFSARAPLRAPWLPGPLCARILVWAYTGPVKNKSSLSRARDPAEAGRAEPVARRATALVVAGSATGGAVGEGRVRPEEQAAARRLLLIRDAAKRARGRRQRRRRAAAADRRHGDADAGAGRRQSACSTCG